MTHHKRSTALAIEAIYVPAEMGDASGHWAEECVDQFIRALTVVPVGVADQDVTIMSVNRGAYQHGLCAGTFSFGGRPFNVGLFDYEQAENSGERVARLLVPVIGGMPFAGFEVSYIPADVSGDSDGPGQTWATEALGKLIDGLSANVSGVTSDEAHVIGIQDIAYAPGVCVGAIGIDGVPRNVGLWDTQDGTRTARVLTPVVG
jgi:hypothetical protein